MIVTDLSGSYNPVPKKVDKKITECKQDKKLQKNKAQIKGKKHKQTKEKEISKKVKEAVWKRDKHKCIFCGKQVDMFYANAHFIPRSQGRTRNKRKHIYCL